jgi:hypothetical protein
VRRVVSISLCLFWAGCSLNTTGSGDDFALGDDGSIDSGVVVDDSAIDGELADTTPAEDSTVDSDMIDSEAIDSEMIDSEMIDSTMPDSTMADSSIDTAVPDTGPFDTGVPDTGTPDTGPFDTGPIDTGMPDTGPEVPVTGILMGSGAAGPTGTINLTTEGTLGWAHWALGNKDDFNHRSAADLITKGTVFGGMATRWGSYPQKFTWSDGTPTVSATTNAGFYVTGKDDGFTFDASGDPAAARTLKLYLAWNNATATVDASLSDGSAPAFSGKVPPTPSGSMSIEPVVYTITFKPITAGAKLNVKITKTSAGGGQYISLLAATLH